MKSSCLGACRRLGYGLLLLLAACHPQDGIPKQRTVASDARDGAAAAHPPQRGATVSAKPAADVQVDRWDALMPAGDNFQRPPPQIGQARNPPGVSAGLIDDNGAGTLPWAVIDHSSPNRAKQFGSSEVVQALDGKRFSLDGYVVPLGTNDAGQVNELLFVPFYGACIHVPPPPPNQIIHVVLAEPIDLPELWNPYRLAGTLRVQRFDADIASASYEAAGASIVPISG